LKENGYSNNAVVVLVSLSVSLNSNFQFYPILYCNHQDVC